jgi:hypothetical protein
MSLSNPIERSTNNPIKRYYTFNGATGTLSYYDKETEQKVEVTEPFVFIPTDEKNAVEGYDSKKEMGFRSNEVISTQKEELTVRWNTGSILIQGFYNDIKDKVKAQGGKYIKSIYGITKIDGAWEMINLRLKGAAFSAWLNFDSQKKGGVLGLTIAITKGAEKKTGMVKYFEPNFKAKQTPVDLHKIAVEKDGELQAYFSERDTPLSQTKMEDLLPEEKSQLRAPGQSKKAVESAEIEDGDADDFFADL